MKRWTGIFAVLALTASLAPAQHPMDMKASTEECAMMKDSAAMDAKLQTLVDDMNKAEGPAKIDKMAAVITELVSQHAAMQSQMMKSMDNCPMMKKMSKTAKKTASAKPMECH
jgi:hypothetical protein